MRVERRLAAIMAADVVGYSRLMGRDEEGTVRQIKSLIQTVIRPIVTEHRGRVVKTLGDGFLGEFASVVEAFECARKLQRAAAKRNTGVAGDKQIILRIGINVGDIIIDDNDVFGDGVIIAARLEGVAEPGGICVSARAWEDLRKLKVQFSDMGELKLKNIEPVRAFAYVPPPPAVPAVASATPTA
uniref:adenylate/guanylate cyclase domain-containing protein n=1 Tax=Phenylobacterium sp. TaxID=1871053 RepID=UPI0025ECBF3A